MTQHNWTEPMGRPEGFMFDLDGTLILSDRQLGRYKVLPGAVEMLNGLSERGIPFVVLTNGSAYHPRTQAPKLREIGLPVPDDAMLTPSSVAADLLPRRGVKRVLLLGSPGVGELLTEAGVEVVIATDKDAAEVDAVYVGWFPECTMKDIELACVAVERGAKLYVASYAPYFATSSGKAFGYSFAIVGAIRNVTRVPMELVGKPSLHALRVVSRHLGVPMRRLAVVGDDPDVEIIMARRGGAMGFGVTSGVTPAETWAAQPRARRPHRIVDRVDALLDIALPG